MLEKTLVGLNGQRADDDEVDEKGDEKMRRAQNTEKG
jgi:hypothetical protein